MRKKILLLGATGSIGQSTLSIIEQYPDDFDILGLSAHSNIDLLERLIKRFHPRFVCISSDEITELPLKCSDKVHTFFGSAGLRDIVREADADIIINGIVGAAGLLPTYEAVILGKTVALANKESLVVAGELIQRELRKSGARLYPIDSEHSAIWQCLLGENTKYINRIILTASGGPFYNRTAGTFDSITITEALNHPNWKMGNKVTIDSATLMNKGFEVIEAHWLFGVSPLKIRVVIHPQSIIHSMVEFVDGSIKAQMGIPDMRLPIQFALTYPERRSCIANSTMLFSGMQLTFSDPDEKQFPCLKLAYQAIDEGGTAPAVLNAANEVAVQSFLDGKIKFLAIPELVNAVLQEQESRGVLELEDYLGADRQARELTKTKVVRYG